MTGSRSCVRSWWGAADERALEEDSAGLALDALPELIDQLELKMKESAKKLDFEEAANLRDRIKKLRQKLVGSSR